MKSTPMPVRQTDPWPPAMEVPPTTMPARTVKDSALPPLAAWALSRREMSMAPPSPAAPPLRVKVTTLIRFTRTPARRAASALPPEATM